MAIVGRTQTKEAEVPIDKILQLSQSVLGVTGRFLLGLYFVLPGTTKIAGYGGTEQYMLQHGVPFTAALLPLTILLQIGGGAALMLAGMTIVVNLFMHDFWNVYEGLSQAHETQNFVKNLAITAGLLALAAGLSAQALSLDRRLNQTTA